MKIYNRADENIVADRHQKGRKGPFKLDEDGEEFWSLERIIGEGMASGMESKGRNTSLLGGFRQGRCRSSQRACLAGNSTAVENTSPGIFGQELEARTTVSAINPGWFRVRRRSIQCSGC